jgi:putative aldouronate transport system permease protein
MLVRKMPGLFDITIYIILTLTCILTLYPFLNVAAVSFSSQAAFIANPMRIWPDGLHFLAYKEILSHPRLWSSYLNTVIVTVSGVTVGIFLYLITAYPLSKRHLRGRGILMILVVFSMLFNGGLIPNYYLMRSLGLLDTLYALILPSLFSGFSLILMKSFMETLPEELEEAARMDGASEPYILFKIIIPLSKPIIATLSLFQAVAYWNNFFNGIVYIQSPAKWPLMLFLREIITGAKMQEIASGGNLAEVSQNVPVESLQYSTLIIVILPILLVYPFLQKYFVKGIMIGSLKG